MKVENKSSTMTILWEANRQKSKWCKNFKLSIEENKFKRTL